jgi:hypothetical protein
MGNLKTKRRIFCTENAHGQTLPRFFQDAENKAIFIVLRIEFKNFLAASGRVKQRLGVFLLGKTHA